MPSELVQIDGAFGEGGGQILRTALALSVVTGRPFEIVRIRANRKEPGLRPQHLQGVRAAEAICGARVGGDSLGSSCLRFEPGEVKPGEYRFDIGTAGATSLVLHTIYLPLSLAGAPSRITITGGTHVPFSPCFHYLEEQWLPFVRQMGLRIALKLNRAGFYPAGGGEIVAEIEPAEGLHPLVIRERGRLLKVHGISVAPNLPEHVARRQKERAEKWLRKADLPHEVRILHIPAVGKGTMLLLRAEFERSQACYFGLGARGKPAERVADEAWGALQHFLRSRGAVDEYLADQLLLPAALIPGITSCSTSRITSHLITNVAVIRQFLPATIEIEGKEGDEGGEVRITGSNWVVQGSSPNAS